MAYDQIISRDASDDPLVPEQFRSELVADLPSASTVMSLARKVPLSSKVSRQPVLSVLPEAYFVNGDTGLKDTSAVDFANSVMTAEEIAVIVPIPEAYLDDSAIPVWGAVRPLIAEAFGKVIDGAVLFGTNKPSTWTDPAIVPGAATASQNVVKGTGADIGVDVAEMGRAVAESGFSLTGFAGEPGFEWQLIGSRATDGSLIYGPSLAAGQPSTLYGRPISEVRNGSWAAGTHLIGGDWNKCIIGVRQDITYKVFTEGVISDATGAVVLNLMQQDSVALRVVMRLGYTLPVPAGRVGGAGRFPFATLTAV